MLEKHNNIKEICTFPNVIISLSIPNVTLLHVQRI